MRIRRLKRRRGEALGKKFEGVQCGKQKVVKKM